MGPDVGEVEYAVESFGRVLMSVSKCHRCGHRHHDALSLSTHDPTTTSLKVQSNDYLKIRVVRGSTGTVPVPELGVSMRPSLNSEGFISNVEGVLARIENVLRFLALSLEGQKKKRANLTLSKIERVRESKVRFTLIVKDPLGNSTIISGKAKRRRISHRELNKLRFGGHAIAAGKRQ